MSNRSLPGRGPRHRMGTITGADADELNSFGPGSARIWKTDFLRPGKHSLGICWFKVEASEHIARIWRWFASWSGTAFT